MNESPNTSLVDSSVTVVPPEEKAVSFPKKESDTKCNGKVHRQEKYCELPAGWGTDHPGTGRCKLHGGCSTGPKSGELRYSDAVPTDVVEQYEKFALEGDVDIKSLDNEIALMRAKIIALERANETATPFAKSSNDRMIVQMTDLVRRLVDTKQRVEEGRKSKITIEVVFKVIDVVIGIIDKYVPDREVKICIAREMRAMHILSDLSPES